MMRILDPATSRRVTGVELRRVTGVELRRVTVERRRGTAVEVSLELSATIQNCHHQQLRHLSNNRDRSAVEMQDRCVAGQTATHSQPHQVIPREVTESRCDSSHEWDYVWLVRLFGYSA